MKTIVVCDDESEIRNDLRKRLEERMQGENWKVIEADSICELKMLFEGKTEHPDILFIDIELEDGNGIDAASEIQKEYPRIAIIFITGHIQYASEIFQIKPLYFLTKPFDDVKLDQALSRAGEFLDHHANPVLSVMTRGQQYQIQSSEIQFIESSRRKIEIVTADGNYTTYMKLGEMLGRLPGNFLMCHKSYLVNIHYIEHFSATTITLFGGKTLPISRARSGAFKEAFLRYFSKRD